MSEISRINESIETISKSLYDFQKKHSEDYEKDKDVTECAIKRMTDDIGKLMEEKQALDARIKFLESQERVAESNEKSITPEQKEVQDRLGVFLRSHCDTKISFKDYLARMHTKSLSSDSNPDGGYIVIPEYIGIMEKRIFESSPIRQVANIMTTSNDSITMTVDNDEATSGWVGEREARDETDTPTLDEIQIHLQEIYAKPKATQRLLDDAGFDVEQWLMRKIADKFRREENNAFVNGTGSKRPRGFLTYPNWTTPNTYQTQAIERIASGVDGGLSSSTVNGADAIINLQNSLIEDYQSGSVFGMSRQTFGEVIKLKTDDGEYLFNRMLDKETGTPFSLLGKAVYFFNDMPPIANNSLSIVYGNFQDAYTILDRAGLRIIRDIYTDKTSVEFFVAKRTGGDVCNFEALKILQMSETV